MSQIYATLVLIVTVSFQQCLRTLTDLVELSLDGNPLCSTLSAGGDDVAVSDYLCQLLPQLEVIDGVSML